MPYIKDRGSPTAKIWIILERPYGSDIPKGVLFSGSMGNVYAKMLREAGLELDDCYVTCRRPNTDVPSAFAVFDGPLNQYQPPLIVVVNEAGCAFLSELRVKGSDDNWRGQLQKNAGSLLTSSNIKHPHYCMPCYGPDRAVSDWQERNVTTYIDFQKLRDELQYFKKHGVLKPLPERILKYQDMDLDELLSYIERFRNTSIIADDIENPIYRSTLYNPHPGYPVLLGLAESPTFGISFKLFRDKPSENRELWRRLDRLFREVTILGQNFFNYDALFHDALGFNVNLYKVQDTLVRHHILWPELPHKLQFMTRQYTREPYYKDEGHSWTLKYMDKYRRYNCLDCCVTYEVFNGQEEEFKQRGYLK